MKVFPNKIIISLIFFDFLFQSAWGFLSPVFAVFVVQKIKGGNLASLGLSIAIFWILKSFFQPFIAYLTDRTKSEKDDFYVLFFGTLLVAFVPLGYFFASHIFHIFFLEMIRALGMASIVPIWSGFFSRYLNRGWESFSWSLDSTLIGLTLGFSAALGGTIANFFGISFIFLIVSFLTFLSAFSLFLIKKELKNFKINDQ